MPYLFKTTVHVLRGVSPVCGVGQCSAYLGLPLFLTDVERFVAFLSTLMPSVSFFDSPSSCQFSLLTLSFVSSFATPFLTVLLRFTLYHITPIPIHLSFWHSVVGGWL